MWWAAQRIAICAVESALESEATLNVQPVKDWKAVAAPDISTPAFMLAGPLIRPDTVKLRQCRCWAFELMMPSITVASDDSPTMETPAPDDTLVVVTCG